MKVREIFGGIKRYTVYLVKWIVLGSLMGLVGGLVAAADNNANFRLGVTNSINTGDFYGNGDMVHLGGVIGPLMSGNINATLNMRNNLNRGRIILFILVKKYYQH